MRTLCMLAFCVLGLASQAWAQFDVSKARAHLRTLAFDDNEHTVPGYIYSTLKERSACCGNDALYLEVRIDSTGAVTAVKPLTGRNDCYKKSIADIVQHVTWDATGITSTKTIYFEVKPIRSCEGSPGENVYRPIPRDGASACAPPAAGAQRPGSR